MSFFRSEPMSLCQMVLHTESAFNCLIVLGYKGKVQFCNIYDNNPLANNQFTDEIKRCQELKRLIGHLRQESNECNIETIIYPNVDEDEIPDTDDLKTMETTVQQIYEDFIQIASGIKALKIKRIQLSEQLQILQNADVFFGTKTESAKASMAWSDSVLKILLKNEFQAQTNKGTHLSFFTGTIPVETLQAFETMLWRVTKGCFYMKHHEYCLSAEAEKIASARKSTRQYIFMVFFLGQELKKKINKMCQGFGIKLFECSVSMQERHIEEEILKKEIFDLDLILERTKEYRYNLLLTASTDLYIWQSKTNKILKVYNVLNHMRHVRHLRVSKYLQAECWIPSQDISSVRAALMLGARRTAQGRINSVFLPLLNEVSRRDLKNMDKPTYFVLNKFTKGFQNLIDSYGMAQYRELNPSPYTIVTFPFLFAVMFGDMGHGLILFLFGIWLVWNENSFEEKQRISKQQSEIFNILFAGRYIITLMGAFSIYTGLIYNDCFSKGLNIFGSSWRANFSQATVNGSKELQLDPAKSEHYLGTPYILGMDPIWKVSGENAITTFNSLKMKLSIILGVCQMVFGLVLSALNYIYKKEYVNLLLVFIPQFTFMLCIFVYLTFLIFFKWMNFGGHIQAPYSSACAPSILITFINMLMFKSPEEPPRGCDTWMFDTQYYIQMGLMILALISVPVLLAGKPIYFMIQQKKIQKIKNEEIKDIRRRMTGISIRRSLLYNVESSTHIVRTKRETDDTQTALSELWIHSGIHCIESVLGSVSHTASYLRLWALSLAHEQLSTVLWNMVMNVGLTGRRSYWNSLVLYVIFIFWATLTLTILVVMEGLSAFLHTLRLHWVEFQSKFYTGNGEPFQPFRFEKSSLHNLD